MQDEEVTEKGKADKENNGIKENQNQKEDEKLGEADQIKTRDDAEVTRMAVKEMLRDSSKHWKLKRKKTQGKQ